MEHSALSRHPGRLIWTTHCNEDDLIVTLLLSPTEFVC